MKIALGTVQLGMPYGVANTSGKPSIKEAEQILNCARDAGIDTLDTALDYGDSEQRLGQIGVGGFKVISKLPGLPEHMDDVSGWVERMVQHSLERLRVESLHALLFHRPDQLLENNGSKLYESVKKLQKKGLVKKIGVSVYGPSMLEKLLSQFDFDIVQAPVNILDRRMLITGWAEKLTDMKIELHARSVFLQGLLLLRPESRPPYFHSFENVWNQFDDCLAKYEQDALKMCLGFVQSLDCIKKIIVGVETHEQLTQLIKVPAIAIPDDDLVFQNADEALLNPSKWQLKVS